jgi:hypothetical protein
MNQPDKKFPKAGPMKAIGSIFELAYGTDQEEENLTDQEIQADLKSMGIDTEKGWQALQSTIKQAQGKGRLAAAREQRLKAAGETSKPGSISDTVQSLIEEIKGLLALGDGNSAVFARKAESMPIDDLKSLRDQMVKTAARAAKKRRDEV